MYNFNGLNTNLSNISRLSNAKTFSISAENFKGEKGKGGMAEVKDDKSAARELGTGWKVSPCISLKAKTVFTLADIKGSGAIKHIWFTTDEKKLRSLVLRMYWDDEKCPSVNVPIGDFFCNGWCKIALVNSAPIVVNPNGGLNSYWQMPFHDNARIEIENLSNEDVVLFFQIDYQLSEIPDDAGYFHASYRRDNPTKYMVPFTAIDGIKGKGQYVGIYMAWQPNSNGWWGEGEFKFYLDGDNEFPTICGTGTEDYFGGAWNFDMGGTYVNYSTQFLGLPQIIKPDGLYGTNTRFGMYRFHLIDPVRFEEELKITVQAIGWRSEGRFLPLQDDISSTVFWYQTHPHAPLIALPNINGLEVI